jgi:hypothetical protein
MIHDVGTIMKLMNVGAGDVVRDIGAIAELTTSVGVVRDVRPNAERTSGDSMVIVP